MRDAQHFDLCKRHKSAQRKLQKYLKGSSNSSNQRATLIKNSANQQREKQTYQGKQQQHQQQEQQQKEQHQQQHQQKQRQQRPSKSSCIYHLIIHSKGNKVKLQSLSPRHNNSTNCSNNCNANNFNCNNNNTNKKEHYHRRQQQINC